MKTKSVRIEFKAVRGTLKLALLALSVSMALSTRADNNWTGAAGDGFGRHADRHRHR